MMTLFIKYKLFIILSKNARDAEVFLYAKITEKKGIFHIWKNFYFWEYVINDHIKSLHKEQNSEGDSNTIIKSISNKMLSLNLESNLVRRIVTEYIAKNNYR